MQAIDKSLLQLRGQKRREENEKKSYEIDEQDQKKEAGKSQESKLFTSTSS